MKTFPALLIRSLAAALASGMCLLGAVDGVVVNGTSGQPQSGVVVTLLQPGAQGMQTLGSVKSDAQGQFKFDKEVPPGPVLVQGLYQGATYNMMLTPGTPTTGVRLNVYDSTSKPGTAKGEQHMILIEPSADALAIGETFLFQNATTTTFQDPKKGSFEFYLPASTNGKVQVTVSAPGGMPIQRPAERTGQPGVYKVSYPLKPGETRFDLEYSVPAATKYSAKLVPMDGPTRLVTAPTVTLTGDGIEPMGQEPRTKANIYNVTGLEYSVLIDGVGSLRAAAGDASADGSAPKEDTGQPGVEEAQARVYTRLPWVLGLTFGILALGGLLLYRRGAA